MATTTKERVIGLWLDAIGGDEPRWIVSRDTFEGGEPSTSTTVAMFREEDYEAARDAAVELASRDGLRVIETDRYGVRKAPEASGPTTEELREMGIDPATCD